MLQLEILQSFHQSFLPLFHQKWIHKTFAVISSSLSIMLFFNPSEFTSLIISYSYQLIPNISSFTSLEESETPSIVFSIRPGVSPSDVPTINPSEFPSYLSSLIPSETESGYPPIVHSTSP